MSFRKDISQTQWSVLWRCYRKDRHFFGVANPFARALHRAQQEDPLLMRPRHPIMRLDAGRLP